MTYKLAISDIVTFQVRLSVNDAGVKKDFSFWFDARRQESRRLNDELEEHGKMIANDFHAKVCRENLTDWRDQRLVVGEDGQGVAFAPEALELVLGLPGAATLIHRSYIDAIVASESKAGRAKN